MSIFTRLSVAYGQLKFLVMEFMNENTSLSSISEQTQIPPTDYLTLLVEEYKQLHSELEHVKNNISQINQDEIN